ncbi:hypothetical protein GCM10023168_16750 [Fodinibacter luteus]|uniref:Uncharacterized protein n=1 Tax=Fodinibacter luteus TaxID=552064 RepID=A0ABP8KDT5_9MICO
MLRRALAVTVALATLVVGLVVGSAAWPSQASAAVTTATDEPAGAVVVVGTGGISWSDVDEQTTPNLWLLLRDGSAAALSVRSVHSNTCPVDGWLGLSSGSRAAGPRPGEAPNPVDRPCTPPPTVTDGVVAAWPTYEAAAAETRFDARLGLLGATAAAGGLCVKAVDPYAAVGGARPDGRVEHYAAWTSERMLEDLNACPVTLVDVGSLRDPDDVADGESVTTSRAEQLAEIDARIGQVIEAGPNGADYVVTSMSDAGVSERLRLVVARGPHFGPGVLVSGSTKQTGLAQLSDVTATVLASVGLPVPDAVGGSPLTSDPAPDNSVQRAQARLTMLSDYDEASHDVHGLVEPFFTVFAYGQLVIYLLVLLVWKGRLGTDRSRVTVLSRVRVLSVVAASVPVSTFLANLLPWWRFPVEMLSVVLAVGLFVAAISTVALRGPWRHWALGPMAVVSATTMLVLAVDVMTGSRLQLSSLMGLQPVVAGRFYGMGNPTFALFATSTILLCTAVSSWLVLAGRRRAAAVAVGVIGGFAVVVDAMPFWGADGGGPPALVPGLAYLVLAVLGLRLTWQRALLVAAGVVGLFFLIAGADWLREPASRSHLGRFVQAIIDGNALDIVVRKAQQNVEILLGNAPLTLLVPAALLFVIYVLARPTSWGSRAMQRSYDQAPTLRAGLIALLITLSIGFLVNDSGVAIPAVGATLAVPLIVSVSVSYLLDEARATAQTRSARRRR